MYKIIYTKNAVEDVQRLKSVELDKKAKILIEIIKENPYQNPPSYEKLIGDMRGACFRRINIKHRLVYEVLEQDKIIKIISMWTHYEY